MNTRTPRYPEILVVHFRNRVAAVLGLLLFFPCIAQGEEISPAHALTKRVAVAHRSANVAAALELLEQEYKTFRAADGAFNDLYATLWHEAQLGGGRDDAHWNAALFEWIQQKSISEGHDHLAIQVAHNTYVGFANLGRYGAARHALMPFIARMQRNKMSLDPATYPDLGPAFEFLPEVRKRDFMRSSRTPSNFESIMQDLAEEDFCAGRWQTALERMGWVDAYLERFGPLIAEPEERWLQSRQNTAFMFYRLGLLEAAGAQYAAVLDHEASHRSYGGRSRLVARMGRLKIRMLTGDANPDILTELDAILEEGGKNRLLFAAFQNDVRRARALYFKTAGRTDDALAVLDGILGDGEGHAHSSARIDRVRLLLESGRLNGLEAEILSILTNSRKSGRKFGEGSIYSLYADLLERQGRLGEALAMRMEAVRIARNFNLFVSLPQELARLSVLLRRCGDPEQAARVAAEATRLASDSVRIPARITAKVADILAHAGGDDDARGEGPDEAALQPLRALVVPLVGMPLRGLATLANPSALEIIGTLTVAGPPATVTWDAATQEATVRLGEGPAENRIAPLRLAPGTLAEINMVSDADATPEGEITISWAANGKDVQTSIWTIEPGEAQVPSAVIEAGLYQGIPFYCVPVHHHYQDISKRDERAAIRVTTARPARVEIHDASDQLIAVDATGNGALTDAGDGIFQDDDFDGFADLLLTAGEAAFHLQIYPAEPLPEDGLEIVIEVRIDGEWQISARDRIVP